MKEKGSFLEVVRFFQRLPTAIPGSPEYNAVFCRLLVALLQQMPPPSGSLMRKVNYILFQVPISLTTRRSILAYGKVKELPGLLLYRGRQCLCQCPKGKIA